MKFILALTFCMIINTVTSASAAEIAGDIKTHPRLYSEIRTLMQGTGMEGEIVIELSFDEEGRNAGAQLWCDNIALLDAIGSKINRFESSAPASVSGKTFTFRVKLLKKDTSL